MHAAPRAVNAWPSKVLTEVRSVTDTSQEAKPLPVGVSYAFPPSARLHRPSEFMHALKGMRIARGDLLVLNTPKTIADSGEVSARLGLIIAKRFAPHAVTRNTIKRVLREAFRLQAAQLPARDYVFRLHSRVGDISLTQLRQQIRQEADRLLRKAQR